MASAMCRDIDPQTPDKVKRRERLRTRGISLFPVVEARACRSRPYTGYTAIKLAGALQSLWPSLPPMAQSCIT